MQTQLKQSQKVSLSLVALTIIGVGAAGIIGGLFAVLLGMQTIVKDNTQLGTAYLVGGPCIENVTQQFATTNNYLWASPQQFQRGDFSFCDTTSEVFTTQTYFRSYYDDNNPCEDLSSPYSFYKCALYCDDFPKDPVCGKTCDNDGEKDPLACTIYCIETGNADVCCADGNDGDGCVLACGGQEVLDWSAADSCCGSNSGDGCTLYCINTGDVSSCCDEGSTEKECWAACSTLFTNQHDIESCYRDFIGGVGSR